MASPEDVLDEIHPRPKRVDVWPEGTELQGPQLLWPERELLLTEAEGWVRLEQLDPLVIDGRALRPAGLWFTRTDKPAIGGPRLFLFPEPYHVVEVMMANRGWGGTYGGDPLTAEALAAIGRFRSTPWPDMLPEAARVLKFANLDTVAQLYRTFTPFAGGEGLNFGPHVVENLGFHNL